jgi:replicative DNA helicase
VKKRKSSSVKPIIPIQPSLFGSLILYMLSDYCNRSFVVKLDEFFQSVETSLYKEDADLEIYYRTLLRIIRIYIDSNITDVQLIFGNLIASPKDGDEIEIFVNDLIQDSEELDSVTAVYAENEIIDRLNHVGITPITDDLRLLLSRFESQDFSSYSEMVSELHTASNNLCKKVIAKTSTSVSIPEITFKSSDSFFTAIRRVRNFMNDEKRVIKTGVKRLNKFLGGGFQPGKVYLANGISGGWKSGWLLNVAVWACKYNDTMKCVDRTKRPCVVYLTQENDTEETIERLISYAGALNSKGKAENEEVIYDCFKQHKILDGHWELRILYRPKHSISTGDLDSILAEIESEGEVEVKMLVHDYVKRIRPAVVTNDIRIDLGEAANDMSILAKARKIPIVTANQLNREAYRSLNETNNTNKDGKTTQKLDQGKKLDASMISESQLLLENVDFAFGQHREQTRDGRVFLAFKKFKNRADKSTVLASHDYFAHPFEAGNGMMMCEDLLLDESLSLDDISSSLGGSVIDSGIEEEDDDEDVTFDSKGKPIRKEAVPNKPKSFKRAAMPDLEAEE